MEAETSAQWRFAQCFGDKGEVDDITEGMQHSYPPFVPRYLGMGRVLIHSQPT